MLSGPADPLWESIEAFELVILKPAKTLGLVSPQSVLLQAEAVPTSGSVPEASRPHRVLPVDSCDEGNDAGASEYENLSNVSRVGSIDPKSSRALFRGASCTPPSAGTRHARRRFLLTSATRTRRDRLQVCTAGTVLGEILEGAIREPHRPRPRCDIR